MGATSSGGCARRNVVESINSGFRNGKFSRKKRVFQQSLVLKCLRPRIHSTGSNVPSTCPSALLALVRNTSTNMTRHRRHVTEPWSNSAMYLRRDGKSWCTCRHIGISIRAHRFVWNIPIHTAGREIHCVRYKMHSFYTGQRKATK